MKNFKSHVFFTKQQRYGIFLLIGIIIILQLVYFLVDLTGNDQSYNKAEYAKFIIEIDSLKDLEIASRKPKIFPFNPNHISDYQGSKLGMSNEEIDRLLAYRNQNRWINSVREFQEVTQVSDSLLNRIAPHFKFPDWVARPKSENKKSDVFVEYHSSERNIIEKQDLNEATADQLKKVDGVGDVLSERIIKFRNIFPGGFISDIQLLDVYGLKRETIEKITEQFTVKTPRIVNKIDLNAVRKDELVKIQHIDYNLASRIIEERTLRNGFKSWEELIKVKDFPVNKLEIIKLYLSLEKENE